MLGRDSSLTVSQQWRKRDSWRNTAPVTVETMRRILLLPVVAALVLVQDVALGADPQPYAVTLQPTGNDALDQALRDSSQLESLREKAPVGPFALITRARDDAARFQTALGSFGYYAAKVTVTVAGRPLDEADLPDLLRDVPAEPPVAVAVAFDPGPVFHLGRVTIEGEVPAAARDPSVSRRTQSDQPAATARHRQD